jgi:hypothetical protein
MSASAGATEPEVSFHSGRNARYAERLRIDDESR